MARSARQAFTPAHGRAMFADTFLGQSATIAGLMAGWIAVGGFIGHSWLSLFGDPESELGRATTIGGLAGLAFAILTVALSALFD